MLILLHHTMVYTPIFLSTFSSNFTNEEKPIYQVLNTNYMTWYDPALIKLSNLFESLGNVGFVRKQ